MPVIHPELESLLDEYNRIQASYDNQHIDLPDAIASIGQLQRIDGQGWVWGIDPNSGQFVKGSPGASPQPADPADFSPPQIPGGAGPLSQPPRVATPPGASSPWAGETPASPWAAHSDSDDFHAPPPPPGRRAPTRSRGGGAAGGWLAANRRIVIIGVVVIIVIALVIVSKAHAPSATTLPTTTTQPAGATTTTQSPTTTTTAPRSTIGAVPTNAQMYAILNTLTNGKSSLSQVPSVVAHRVSGVATDKFVAFFSGLAAIGAYPAWGSVHRVSHGVATSVFGLDASGSHARLYTAHATWVVSSGHWKLLTWPTFS